MLIIYIMTGIITGFFLRVIINQLPLSIIEQSKTANVENATHLPTNTLQTSFHLNRKLQYLRHMMFVARRNPSLEIVNCLLYIIIFKLWPGSEMAIPLCLFGSSLIILALIDYKYLLLPDAITQPLLWAGILWSSSGSGFVPLPDAVWGAASGYMILWITNLLFLSVTGKHGLGQGDYKLLAMFGAWSGTGNIICVLSLAPAIALLFWIFIRPVKKTNVIPFGPSLVIAEVIGIILLHTDILEFANEALI